MLWAVIAANVVLLTLALSAPHVARTLTPASILPEEGRAFIVQFDELAFPYQVATDRPGDKGGSRLRLTEDSRPLGPSHSAHESIRKDGGGRYSHWSGYIYFSSSDGSDPRTNGRTYVSSASAELDRWLLMGMLAVNALIVLAFAQELLAFVARRGALLFRCMVLFAVVVAALAATGLLGPINHDRSVPKDADVVVAAVVHAVLGLAISLAMWVVGTGLARYLPWVARERLAPAALLGFLFSLPLTAAMVVLALVMPRWGPWLAVSLALASLGSYAFRPLPAMQLRQTASVALALSPFALLFGTWLGLNLHGPTETQIGATFGDLTYYAGIMWNLEVSPLTLPNLGVLGEPQQSYLNMLWPGVGAVLLRQSPIDPHLFLASGGGSAYVVNIGLALTFFLSGINKRTISWPAAIILFLAVVTAARYPSWTIESIPVIHAMPLALSVGFWSVQPTFYASRGIVIMLLAFVGSALSKVVLPVFIVPLTLAPFTEQLNQLSRRNRIVLFVVLAMIVLYGLWLVQRFLPWYLGLGNMAPESVLYFGLPGAQWPEALVFFLRELGFTAFALVCVLTLRWPVSLAITMAIMVGILYPYLFSINTFAAVLVAASLLVRNEEVLGTRGRAVIAALLLALPACVLTDPAGGDIWLVWLIAMSGLCVVALGEAAPWSRLGSRLDGSLAGRASTAVAVIFGLVLVAVANGHLAVTDRARVESAELTPTVRDIWRAVRELTPLTALVFTDQVSDRPTLLGGWNTYAFSGQRQVYLSSILTSPMLRKNFALQKVRLSINRDVLNGMLKPSAVEGAERFSSYLAVIRADAEVPVYWVELYRNRDFVLYQIATP